MVTKEEIWELLLSVTDPEIPALTIMDLGIVRDIVIDNERIEVVITPTYTGCPAMDMISMQIKLALAEHGYKNVAVKNVLSPAWTTNWMTEEGKQKLKAYGIAPPNPKQTACTFDFFQKEETVQCPHRNSLNTKLISRFGSTACKALYQCNNCKEPFDYFKCH
jgi:ring-1,2-phenylacetyl-CoA epoxidase subunit PaaD